jgi:hypothetical protein
MPYICHHSSEGIWNSPRIGVKSLDVELVDLEVKPIHKAYNNVSDVHFCSGVNTLEVCSLER